MPWGGLIPCRSQPGPWGHLLTWGQSRRVGFDTQKPPQGAAGGDPCLLTPSPRRNPILGPSFSPGAATPTARAVFPPGGTQNLLLRTVMTRARCGAGITGFSKPCCSRGGVGLARGSPSAPSWLRCLFLVRRMKRDGSRERERKRKDSHPTCRRCHTGWVPPGRALGVPSPSQHPLLGDEPSRTPSIPKHSGWEPGELWCVSAGTHRELEHLHIAPPFAWAFPSSP